MKLTDIKILSEEAFDPNEAADKIWTDCKPFLRESGFDPNNKETWLYRGVPRHVYEDKGPFFETEPSLDRRPLNTTKRMHEAVDQALFELTGIRFRSQGVFTTGNENEASGYGAPGLIFPKGRFDYCWSGLVDDAYIWFDNDPSMPKVLKRGFIVAHELDHDYPEKVKEWIKEKGEYRFNKRLREALSKNTEIMISCDSYYMLRVIESEETLGRLKEMMK